jgi:hypothetical protein
VIVTVSANAAYTVGSPSSATVTIADNDQAQPPTVTVAATDANAAEAGLDRGTFTVSRTGDTSSALTVNYTIAGTAINGTDYQSLSGSVSIPAGAASAVVTVTPIDDTTVEGNETVILTVSGNAAYTVGSPSGATITIADNDQAQPPTVTVAATDANAAEAGPDRGTFSVSRTGDTSSALTVNYTIAGTAINGTDYQSLSGTVNIPAGAASATVTVTPIDDTTVEDNETVILTLSPKSGYTVGSPDSATVTIADNDQPSQGPAVVSVIASDPLGSEPGTDTAAFTVSRTGDLSAPLTVRYTLGGTALNGLDYQALSGAVTIPIGAASANVVLRPIDDNLFEVAELVILTLAPDAAYQVGALSIAVVTIADNDLLILGPLPAGSAPQATGNY